METPIHDFLLSYAKENPVRCHMPGGKEQPFDISEIEGADSLFESSGIIRQSEENAAKLFGAGETLFSCGGSTLAIQTMLASAKTLYPNKNRVAASRYCHKSLIASCVMLGLEVDWIKAEGFLSCEISSENVREVLRKDTLCVFVQSIDYYGGECDIRAISEVCRENDVLLLVDNAHGAYRVFTDEHPLKSGADMTADSAHKTLPCITGTAYLHISKSAPEKTAERAKELMGLFGSSSPSYLMLNSLDLCNRFIAEQADCAKRVFKEVKRLKERLEGAGYKLRKSDLMKVTIDACEYGYSGFELSEELRKRGVSAEYADGRYVVLLFSVSQDTEDFERVFTAAEGIQRRERTEYKEPVFGLPPIAMTAREAVLGATEEIEIRKAVGRVCGSVLCSCPPCVPVIMPGEVFTEEILEVLGGYGVERVRCVRDTSPLQISKTVI